MTRKKSDEIAACRRNNLRSITTFRNLDFDDLPPLTGQRREQLLDLLSRPDILTDRELCYYRFLRYLDLDFSGSGMTRTKGGRYFFPTSSINNDARGDYGGEIEFSKSVTAVIHRRSASLKIRSCCPGDTSSGNKGGNDRNSGHKRNFFFRNTFWSFEPPEKQHLAIHVFEQESNLISVMLQEMSRWDSHVYCYGIWQDPEIFDGDGKEILKGFDRDLSSRRPACRKMSFTGSYIVFMDAGSYYFQKLSAHHAVKAPVLEADFSGKNRLPADEGGDD